MKPDGNDSGWPVHASEWRTNRFCEARTRVFHRLLEHSIRWEAEEKKVEMNSWTYMLTTEVLSRLILVGAILAFVWAANGVNLLGGGVCCVSPVMNAGVFFILFSVLRSPLPITIWGGFDERWQNSARSDLKFNDCRPLLCIAKTWRVNQHSGWTSVFRSDICAATFNSKCLSAQ